MSGNSIEESRAQRKAEAMQSLQEPPTIFREDHHHAPSLSASLSPLPMSLPAKSPHSILKAKSRPPRSSAQRHGSQLHDGDENGDITITNLSSSLPRLRKKSEKNIPRHGDSDEHDDDDPFGRSINDRKKRKRDDRIVTFASVDEGFDLDMSD